MKLAVEYIQQQQLFYHKEKDMRAGTFKLECNIELVTTDHYTGEVKDRSEIKNDIVNVGLEEIAKLLNGVDTTYFRAIAIGTGDTAVSSSQTALVTEVARESATLSYEADYKAKFVKVFTFGSGVSYTIKEVGIFNISTSGGVMFNRAIDAGKAVDANTDLTATITITASEAVA